MVNFPFGKTLVKSFRVKMKNRCIVRVSTSYWNDSRGIYSKKALTILRRQSVGYACLLEDAVNIGADEAFKMIINLEKCEDGVYEVLMVDGITDYETGYVEDWSYELVPYAPSETERIP